MNHLHDRTWLALVCTAVAVGALAACETLPPTDVDAATSSTTTSTTTGVPAPSPAARAALVQPPSVAGALRPADGGYTFQPCGAPAPRPLIDRTEGVLAAAVADLSVAGEPLFVELELASAPESATSDAAPSAVGRSDDGGPVGVIGIRGLAGSAKEEKTDRPSDVIATGVVRASPIDVDYACKRAVQPVHAVAAGNEPFWTLVVEPETITLLDVGGEAEMHFPYRPAMPTFGGFAFQTSAANPIVNREARKGEVGNGETRLTATFRERRCTDTMSGAWSSFAVTVAVGPKFFQGCGHLGRLFGEHE